jgi:flagellar FliL protein
MAESAHDASSGASTPPQSKSGGMLTKIIALLFVCAVIFAECLIAYIYLGRSGSGEAAASTSEEGNTESESADSKESEAHGTAEAKGHAGKQDKASHGKKEAEKGGHGKGSENAKAKGGKAEPQAEFVEVDLEKFTVTAHQPTSSTTMRIEFHLFGMVAAKDQDEFEELVRIHQHRLREQVIVIVRRAEPGDLADPGLGLIKRQILEKTNALLGKPLLQSVVVSDFSYIEQ